MNIRITTNNNPRDILTFHELTEAEQREAAENIGQEYAESMDYFWYKGQIHCLSDFMVAGDAFPDWAGYFPETYFSGLLVRVMDDGERVIIGRYCVEG